MISRNMESIFPVKNYPLHRHIMMFKYHLCTSNLAILLGNAN
jgi:hypothetical protein